MPIATKAPEASISFRAWMSRLQRPLIIALLALSVVGLIYLFRRMVWVPANHTAILENGWPDTEDERIQILQPGVHLILPFYSWIVKVISMQYQNTSLTTFVAHTKDKIASNVDAGYSYQITDPKLTTAVKDFDRSLDRKVRSTIVAFVEETDYNDVSSVRIQEFLKSQNPLVKDLLECCKNWGVKLLNITLTQIDAKHNTVGIALEEDAAAKVHRKALLTHAQAELEAVKINVDIIRNTANGLGLEHEIVYNGAMMVKAAAASGYPNFFTRSPSKTPPILSGNFMTHNISAQRLATATPGLSTSSNGI